METAVPGAVWLVRYKVVRILWQLGYVRVAYGALYVASQYSCRTAAVRFSASSQV